MDLGIGLGRGLRCCRSSPIGWRRHSKALRQFQVLCQTLWEQGSVCKIFRVGQLVAAGQWHRCLGYLCSRSLRGGHGHRGTRALKHQLQHIGRQDAAFLPLHDHRPNWHRRWNQGRNLGRIPGSGSSRCATPRKRRQRLQTQLRALRMPIAVTR